jgi:diguanylate cyclase (GGDEF)-like protein
MDRLEQELRKARRNCTPLAVMLLDLDRFKAVNDTLGHAAGDALLQQMAVRLSDLLRSSDTVARIGGDEFMFVLPDIGGPEQARAVADKILAAVDQPVRLDGNKARVAGSLGMALFPEHGDQVDDLIRKADHAMYRAKEVGRCNDGSNVCACEDR